jgi:hypothetical protein
MRLQLLGYRVLPRLVVQAERNERPGEDAHSS